MTLRTFSASDAISEGLGGTGDNCAVGLEGCVVKVEAVFTFCLFNLMKLS